MPSFKLITEAYRKDARMFNRGMAKMKIEHEENMDGLTRDFLNRIAEGFIDGKMTAAGLSRSLSAVNSILEAALPGLSDQTTETASNYVRSIVEASNAIFERYGLDLPTETGKQVLGMPSTIQSLNAIHESIRAAGFNTADKLRDMLEGYYYSGEDFAAFENKITSLFGEFRGLGYTVANTMVARTDREYRVRQAQGTGSDLMIYVGADDAVTRPWCSEHLNLIRSITYWTETKNDTNPQPPLLFGGGWNCRHRLLPWKSSWKQS